MAEKVRCIIICGSPDTDPGFVRDYVCEDDYVICADRGYEIALKAGITPDVFVGDFDSFCGKIAGEIEVEALRTHKDDTDSMHCAELAADRGFKNVFLLGALGGRLDHTFANLSVLEYLCDNNINASVESESESVRVLNPGAYSYTGFKGKTFSVFPFGCEETVVTYLKDVEYPADSLTLKSAVAVGISNIFKSDCVKIRIESGTALVIVNK